MKSDHTGEGVQWHISIERNESEGEREDGGRGQPRRRSSARCPLRPRPHESHSRGKRGLAVTRGTRVVRGPAGQHLAPCPWPSCRHEPNPPPLLYQTVPSTRSVGAGSLIQGSSLSILVLWRKGSHKVLRVGTVLVPNMTSWPLWTGLAGPACLYRSPMAPTGNPLHS